MIHLESTRIPPSIVQTARYFVKAGEVITRIAVLLSIVTAIYLAAHMAQPALRGLLTFREIAENVLLITLNLACAGTISVAMDKWYLASKFRLLGLADLLAGAITLISAPVSGVLFIMGGLLFYVASEMISIFRIEEKLV
ncbi:hypothetical protein IG193_00315 [Infirmifilum lucidum]|uniref:Uncharacterized protein n=1 Tax=Infirmifilum lucidum TaxID=2776706 RepID=A0A7L9FJH8_9CREN|nr:hypothetical protein [Infirmifilum lucidum]QOJ78945.1 hypothetical protein IG193_00315 [Infirmifilum lucidum]